MHPKSGESEWRAPPFRENRQLPFKFVALPSVIGVEERNVLSLGMFHADVFGASNSPVSLIAHQAQSRLIDGCDDLSGVVLRSIIDNDDFEFGHRLSSNTPNGARHRIGTVKRRDYRAHERRTP